MQRHYFFAPTVHFDDGHRVIAKDVHHLDSDLAPPWLALVEHAGQFQRAVLLGAEDLPFVLEDVVARPSLFPFARCLAFCTRMISRLLSKSKSTDQ